MARTQEAKNIRKLNDRIDAVAKMYGTESAIYASYVSQLVGGRSDAFTTITKDGIVHVKESKLAQAEFSDVVNKLLQGPTAAEIYREFIQDEEVSTKDEAKQLAEEYANASGNLDAALKALYTKIGGDLRVLKSRRGTRRKDKEAINLLTKSAKSKGDIIRAARALEKVTKSKRGR